MGLFGNQNTVCKPTTPKWSHIIERLKQVWEIGARAPDYLAPAKGGLMVMFLLSLTATYLLPRNDATKNGHRSDELSGRFYWILWSE